MHKFFDNSADRKYFTILPNILWADELQLSAHDLILYATIKKVAGENGTCFMSTRRLAHEAKISTGQVSKSKRKLANAGLIEIITKRRHTKGWPIDHITVNDIWGHNIEHFQNRSHSEQTPQSVHPVNTSTANCSPGERNCSPGELEEEPFKKNTARQEEKEGEEEVQQAPASASHSQIYKLLSSFGVDEPALSQLSNNGLTPQQVKGWTMYLDTQDFPRQQGYLVKRLRQGDQAPANFQALASLSNEQAGVLENAAQHRLCGVDWYQSLDDLDDAGIDEELAESWYQDYWLKKETRS